MSKELLLARGIRKRIVTKGQGDKLEDGAVASVLYTGKLNDGKIFDSTEWRGNKPMRLEVGSPVNLDGWNIALQSMKCGEKATFLMPPECALGVMEHPDIPAGSCLDFEIEVVEVEKKEKIADDSKDVKDFSLESLRKYIDDAQMLKEHGNTRLMINDAKAAIYKYKQGLQFIELVERRNSENRTEKLEAADVERLNSAATMLYANLAQALLQTEQYSEAIDYCNKVLSNDAKHSKALYRKARALQGLNQSEEALACVSTLLELEADNTAAQRLQQQIMASTAAQTTPASHDLSASVGSKEAETPSKTETGIRRRAVKADPLAVAAKKMLQEGLYPDKPDVILERPQPSGWRAMLLPCVRALQSVCPCGSRQLRSLEMALLGESSAPTASSQS